MLSSASSDLKIETAAPLRIAWPRSRPGSKHRLQVERGAADHLQYFASRGLLLQGLSEIAVAFLQFLKTISRSRWR